VLETNRPSSNKFCCKEIIKITTMKIKVEVKLSLPCHEPILVEQRYTSTHS